MVAHYMIVGHFQLLIQGHWSGETGKIPVNEVTQVDDKGKLLGVQDGDRLGQFGQRRSVMPCPFGGTVTVLDIGYDAEGKERGLAGGRTCRPRCGATDAKDEEA
jgi:hypothetical protein